MSILRSKDFLSSLIKTGSDASLNLFVVSFRPYRSDLYSSLLSLRTTEAPTIVTRNNTTTTIPFQNVDISLLSAGSSITKTQTFGIRIDSKYKVLDTLRLYQCIDSNGNFLKNENKSLEITVDALSPVNRMYSYSEYETVYRWVFNDCYITELSPLSFNYESPTFASVNATFVWGTYSEKRVENEDSLYITGSDVTESFFSQAKRTISSLSESNS